MQFIVNNERTKKWENYKLSFSVPPCLCGKKGYNQ